MLNDAEQIIADVPGKHLDPQLLVRSQAGDSLGFIMISYEDKPAIANTPPSRYYDLLFFRGPDIYECARMNRDLRFQIRSEAAFQTFTLLGREGPTRVSLYVAPVQILDRFRSTFRYEPCLKVQIEGLTKKQIGALLRGTECHKGIIECNEFINPIPSLDLREINSLDDIIHYHPAFKRGRILVYDIEKNKELIEQRHASQSVRSVKSTMSPPDTLAGKSTSASGTSTQLLITSKDSTPHEALSPDDEQEAEEFRSFINQILNSPRTVEDKAPNVDTDSEGTTVVITRRSESIEPPASTKSEPCSPPLQRWDRKPPRRSAKPHPEQSASEAQQKQSSPEPSEYTKLLERLFRSFRQQVFDSFGEKCDDVIAAAERKVRFLAPEFDLHSLNENTAIHVLDLIESIAGGASFMKRSSLRQAALTLVADLYNKQYELFEQHRVIDKVEQFYYRLKK
jgi:hypothetical protein